MNLTDLQFYKTLRKRNSEKSSTFTGILLPIANDINSFLQYVKNLFDTYTDHSIQHSFRILEYIYNVLDKMMINSITDTEIFCLIMAALFHDTGMALYNCKDKDEVRNKHHEFSTYVIDSYFEEKLKLLENSNRIKNVVIFVCRSHGFNIDDLYSDEEFLKNEKIDFQTVRYSLLSILLRIGDLMDIEENRTNSFILSLFGNKYSKESLDHNLRHRDIITYDYSSSKIKIEVVADTIDQFKIWSTWFDYLKNEVLRANTYFIKAYFFPMPDTIIKKRDGANFDVEELRFEIDDKGGIWNLLSQSIYTDELDFLRELVQNAIDATLIDIYLNKNLSLDYSSPRSWNSQNDQNNIYIGYSENKNLLFISDTGIGMNKDALKNYLFKVSESGYTYTTNRHFAFPGIAKFGIGFVSCLIHAEQIKIFTKKRDDNILYYVSLDNSSNLAFIEKINNTLFEGTTIILHLKDSYTTETIKEYLMKTFVYPSIDLMFIDLDAQKTLCNNLSLKNKFNELSQDNWKFRTIYDYVEKQRKSKQQSLSKNYNIVLNIENIISVLVDWVKYNIDYDENFSDHDKFIYFKNKIKEINENITEIKNILNKEFPLSYNHISEKKLFLEPEYYTTELTGFLKSNNTVFKTIKNEYGKCASVDLKLSAQKVELGPKWKYCIVFFNDLFVIKHIYFGNELQEIPNEETGIIFICNKYKNYDLGIEYASINGFLFSNGIVCNSIARFTKYDEEKEQIENEEYFVAGLSMQDNDIEYFLEEDFWDKYDNLLYTEPSNNYITCQKYKNYYDSLCVLKNKFLVLSDINISNYESLDFKGLDKLLSQYNIDAKNFFSDYNFTHEFINSRKFAENHDEIDKIFRTTNSGYFQDGIQLPNNIENLIPFGFFKIHCNCTSNARMSLNITRHKSSENRIDIDNWIKNVGFEIQHSIINSIKNDIEALNLYINFYDLLPDDIIEQDYFSKSCFYQLKKIIKEL